MKSLKVLGMASALLAGQAFAGNEVVLTVEGSKGGSLIGLDVVGDGQATGFQFAIKLPADVAAAKKGIANTTCVAQLPKSMLSSCVIKDGEIRVAAVDSTSKAIPTELTSVGTVFVPGLSAAKANSLEIVRVEFGDPTGSARPFSASINNARTEAKAVEQ